MMLVVATFFGLMLLGMPVAFVLGIAGMVGMAQIGERFLAMGPDRFFAGLNLFPFLAMPFFVLAGEIMNRTGITDRLVAFAYSPSPIRWSAIPGAAWRIPTWWPPSSSPGSPARPRPIPRPSATRWCRPWSSRAIPAHSPVR